MQRSGGLDALDEWMSTRGSDASSSDDAAIDSAKLLELRVRGPLLVSMLAAQLGPLSHSYRRRLCSVGSQWCCVRAFGACWQA